MFARFCNVVVAQLRAQGPGWKGAGEPGVQGDLIILLSQDRWIRMTGLVDDLKVVTSGQWLRDMNFFESSVTAFATVLVYLDAALASNADLFGKIVLVVLLIASVGLLAIANEKTEVLHQHGLLVKVKGEPERYERRLIMAKELVKKSKRKDWALKMGMINEDTGTSEDEKDVSSKQGSQVDVQGTLTM